MNLGLIHKSFREVWAMTLLCGMGLFVFESAVAPIFWTYQEQLTDEIMEIEMVRAMLSSLLGADIIDEAGPGMLVSLAWAHPLMLSILWAQVITFATRVPAGEIDRATVDVLFGLPVSRWNIYISESVVWLGSGMAVLGLAALGCAFGNSFVPPEGRPDWGQLAQVLFNLYCLYLCIGALAFLLSTLSNRRGRAVGGAFGMVLALFLWNFLTEYWSALDRVDFLNILSYYKPMLILNGNPVPAKDVAVLLGCATSLWTAGGVVLSRRDIYTV